MTKESEKFHSLAKDAGNKLRAYILSVSSGATGVFFFTLASKGASSLSGLDKLLLIIGMLSFVSTVAISLLELRIDAQRFFDLAKEVDKNSEEQSWERNDKYKRQRYFLLHTTYITFGVGILSTSAYLTLKVVCA